MTLLQKAAAEDFERRGGVPGTVLAGPRLEMMSPGEERELLVKEELIQKGLKTFDQVAECLREIREKRLYRAKFATFKEYCEVRWGWSDRRVRQLTDGAETLESVRSQVSGVRLPENEGQVRPLTRLPKEEQGPTWERVVREAEGKKITAKRVEEAVREVSSVRSQVSGGKKANGNDLGPSAQQRLSNLEKRLAGIKSDATEIHNSPEIQKDRTLSYCARAVLRALDELDIAIARRRAKLCGRT